MIVIATSGGWILVVVSIVLLAGVAYGFFTRAGSGINQHPIDARNEAPGVEGPSEVTGRDEGEGSALDTHGTR